MSGPGGWVRRVRWPRVTLRSRLALISACAVALAIVAASAAAWVITQQVLRAGVDAGLSGLPPAQVSAPGATGPSGTVGSSLIPPEAICQVSLGPASRLRGFVAAIQLVRADGTSCTPEGMTGVRPTAADVAVAAGAPATRPRDGTDTRGRHVRVLTSPWQAGYAVMVSRDLTEVDHALDRLGVTLIVVTGLGVLGAFGVGLVVARAGLRPIDQLTAAAEHVATTQQLDVPIAVSGSDGGGAGGSDEVARLARAFNAMMDALTAARARQQQLIADAGHELRTPLTSLRTNIDLLVRSHRVGRPLPAATRDDVLASVGGQLAELTDLVSGLTVLAGEEPGASEVDVPLDEVVGRAVERARRRGGQSWDVATDPWVVRADPALLERAVLNVLDNAVKFSPDDSTIEVRLAGGVLDVVDRGPGIPPAERALVFDRFWRSAHSRALPGSGLGLAIVADVAARCRGSVEVFGAAGGGTRVSLRLPGRGSDPAAHRSPRDDRCDTPARDPRPGR
jgi:two-component system, OmpR family, sensor histidine kinase MprB